MSFCFLLQFIGSDSGLRNDIQRLCIKFNNFIHPLHNQYNPAINRNSTAGQSRTGPPGRNRNNIFIGQTHNRCNLLRVFGKYHNFGVVMILWISFFIRFVRL